MKKIGFIALAFILCGAMVLICYQKKETAQQLVQFKSHGAVSQGGIIQHVTYPDSVKVQYE